MTALIEALAVGKSYGTVVALRDVSMLVAAGEVTCVLGDNAPEIHPHQDLSGVHRHDTGELRIAGAPTRLASPRAALDRGIAAANPPPASGHYSCWTGEKRNISLGKPCPTWESTSLTWNNPSGHCPADNANAWPSHARCTTAPKRSSSTNPPPHWASKQAGAVLRYVIQARDRGLGVVIITHNPDHAYLIGDRFLLLERGTALDSYEKPDIGLAELTQQMAGGAELNSLQHELQRVL